IEPADRSAVGLAGESAPGVGARIVTSAGRRACSAVAPPAPDDHFFASPDRSHLRTCSRRIHLAHRAPTVGPWVVEGAVVLMLSGREAASAAPNDHLLA